MRNALFLVGLLTSPVPPRVLISDSEVWLVRDGRESQLTHDGKSKLQAELSPTQNRIAYYEECTEAEHCAPTVIVLDLEGHRITSFQPRYQTVPTPEPCASILSIAWVGDNVISAVCHGNPSMSEYIEVDLSTGQTIRDLVGYNFTVSANGKEVAHVGAIRHFSPPYDKSEYLQIDHTTVYPLPKGMSPFEQKGMLPERAEVVHKKGLIYEGIHEFMSRMYWSPDAQRIALVDCVHDWQTAPNSQLEGDGKEFNHRCSLVVVSKNGEAAPFPLNDLSTEDLRKVSMSWASAHELSIETDGLTKTFAVP